jgi:hypothetical protein
MGIVAPLIKDKVKKTTHKALVKQKAIDVLVGHARTQKSLWNQIVKARAKLIGKAIHKNKGNNPLLKTVAEKFAKIRSPR